MTARVVPALGSAAGFGVALGLIGPVDLSLAVRVAAGVGLGAVIVAPSVYLLRRARPYTREVRVAFLASTLASGPLALLGGVLQSRTHHRALGGVTFATLALLLLTATTIVVYRALEAPRRFRGALRSLLGAACVASAALVLGGLLSSGFRHGSTLGSSDVLLAIGFIAIGASVPAPREAKWVTSAGTALWALAVLATLACCTVLPSRGLAARRTAPVLSSLL